MPELSRSSKQNRERCANYEFISYCGEVGDFADKLKQRPIEYGFNTWMHKDDIPAGSNGTIEIDNALRKAASLILIMTPPAFKSQYVQYEGLFAIRAGVSVVPILLKPTKLHPRIFSLQYFDFTIRRRRPWEDLYYRLSDKNCDNALSELISLCLAPSIRVRFGLKRVGLFERSEFRHAPNLTLTRR